ncbi:MAG: glutaredoxin family protein [Chloroflexota bacterium]|nr:glutaredoxin family protein [Dehalococcoidia bacterium]MDW8253116.1 glutaredoxin family protein [Chloroflexota bacterium]
MTIYTRADSADCRALKLFLDARGVPYRELDARHPGVRHQMFQRYGVLVVPIVVIGRQAFFGFAENRAAIERALREGVLRPTEEDRT